MIQKKINKKLRNYRKINSLLKKNPEQLRSGFLIKRNIIYFKGNNEIYSVMISGVEYSITRPSKPKPLI